MSCRSMPNHSLTALSQTSHFVLSADDISALGAKLLCASFDPAEIAQAQSVRVLPLRASVQDRAQ